MFWTIEPTPKNDAIVYKYILLCIYLIFYMCRLVSASVYMIARETEIVCFKSYLWITVPKC